MRIVFTLILMFVLVGCSVGTATSGRPALTKPAIGPDGVTWDAFLAAQRHDTKAFRYALSVRYIHSHLLPSNPQKQPRYEKAFFEEEDRLLGEIEPAYSSVVDRMLSGMMKQFREYGQDRMLETSKPEYEIKFKDSWGRSKGPNLAWVTMRFHDLDAQSVVKDEEEAKPKEDDKPSFDDEELSPAPPPAFELQVRLVQYGQRWVIDGLEPDELKGAFSR